MAEDTLKLGGDKDKCRQKIGGKWKQEISGKIKNTILTLLSLGAALPDSCKSSSISFRLDVNAVLLCNEHGC